MSFLDTESSNIITEKRTKAKRTFLSGKGILYSKQIGLMMVKMTSDYSTTITLHPTLYKNTSKLMTSLNDSS